MKGLACSRCGEGLLLDGDARYEMTIEIKAAYDPLEISAADLEKDLEAEMERTIQSLEDTDAEELERQVYYRQEFDLCGRCRRVVMDDPLFRKR